MTERHQANGRIAIIHGRTAVVADDDGPMSFCQLKGRHLKPVCGDWVVLDDDRHIVKISQRRNEFPRVDARGRRRVVAANLDRVLIVVAPRPAPNRFLLDRYLVACHAVRINAAVVINKADLIESSGGIENVDSAIYERLGYPVFLVQAKAGTGIAALEQCIGAGTGILVGQSGVGKSTIANRLIPDLDAQTQALSDATGKGRHTTSTSTLYQMPAGGSLIDSPGVWEFGIWHLSGEEIESGFIEFAPYRGQCRFNDCQHRGEPKCAVAQAVSDGHIARARFEAYQAIVATNEKHGGSGKW